MVARGGGARDLELFVHPLPSSAKQMLVVHLLVDTRDAMGANLVNGMCEGVAPLVESITGGEVFLRILSNLADRSLVRARCKIPVEHLAGKGYTGVQARDGIIVAGEFAAVDPYRAATHNKGVMNGIDPIAIATATTGARSRPARTRTPRAAAVLVAHRLVGGREGNLCGRIELPIKVGIVGRRSSRTRPWPELAAARRRVRDRARAGDGGVRPRAELAAIRARDRRHPEGHMTLTRSVVTAAGAPKELFDEVLDRDPERRDKVWKAQEDRHRDPREKRARSLRADVAQPREPRWASATAGSCSASTPSSTAATRSRSRSRSRSRPRRRLRRGHSSLIRALGRRVSLATPRERAVLVRAARGRHARPARPSGRAMRIEVFPEVPRSMGLGGSAAMAVAIIRALDKHFKLSLTDAQVNSLAFESEKVAHGSPSGLDNTLACYGKALVFRPGEPPLVEPLNIREPIPAVIGMTGYEGLTAKTVGRVREAWQQDKKLYERFRSDRRAHPARIQAYRITTYQRSASS
jgi:hydroxymethylglutaryl-CoA reductase